MRLDILKLNAVNYIMCVQDISDWSWFSCLVLLLVLQGAPAVTKIQFSSFTVTSGHREYVELHLLNSRFFVQFIKEDDREGNRISIISYIFGNFFGYQFKFPCIWQQTVHSKLNLSKASRWRLDKTTCFGICIPGRQLQMILLQG